MDTSGFYNKDAMLRAGKFVIGPDFELHSELKDTYTYPVNGWIWFDSAEEAAASFEVNIDDMNLDLPTEIDV
jgi:hypothetical protein